MFDKDCAMCCYMGTCENNDGKFPCTSPKVSAKYVSANQNASDCNSYTPSFSSRRGESEMERLRKISRNKGYYIMTAIMDILNIPEKDIYIAGNLEEETELLQKEAAPADITLQTIFLTIFCC